ncbi:hypothetical protein ACFWGX_25920, partial [Streptomyces sp. NPDC060322]
MTAQDLAGSLRGRLIVSCQAPPGDPMRETSALVRLARSAAAGGGAGGRRHKAEGVTPSAGAAGLPGLDPWEKGNNRSSPPTSTPSTPSH